MSAAALSVECLAAGYGDITAVWDVSLEAQAGSMTVVLGRNGAGKTTSLLAIAGLLRPSGGIVRVDGVDVTRTPAHRRVRRGVSLVAEGKRVFRGRTVEQNLRVGAWRYRRDRGRIRAGLERSYDMFPALAPRRGSIAGALSGGQQQMLAIAQALMAEPTVLLLDEPSAGLAPAVVRDVLEVVRQLKARRDLAVVLVEQLIDQVLPIADSIVVMDGGRVALSGAAATLDHDVVRTVYLGNRSDVAPRAP